MNKKWKNPYRTKKKAAPPRAKAPKPSKVEIAEKGIGEINGRMAQSSNEWNVARALWALGWDFDYQYSINWGRRRRGGQVLDFVVHTPIEYTVIRVQVEYWHRYSQLERWNAGEIIRALGRGVEILDMTNDQSKTFEDAHKFLSTEIGRG